MAIHHLSVKPVSRSKGRSATAAAAYRAGIAITDERTGIRHDYRRRSGVESTDLVMPKDAAPIDRADLWNAVEQKETRKNSTVAREFEIGLPAELDKKQRKALALQFARELVDRHGFVADVCIHTPDAGGDERNHHAHILTSTRRYEGGEFTDKCRELDVKTSGVITEWRERWAELVNDHLAKVGSDARVDHRSLEAQGIDRAPTIHLGPAASAMQRKGKQTDRGQELAEIIDLNERRRQVEKEISDERNRIERNRSARRTRPIVVYARSAAAAARLDAAEAQEADRADEAAAATAAASLATNPVGRGVPDVRSLGSAEATGLQRARVGGTPGALHENASGHRPDPGGLQPAARSRSARPEQPVAPEPRPAGANDAPEGLERKQDAARPRQVIRLQGEGSAAAKPPTEPATPGAFRKLAATAWAFIKARAADRAERAREREAERLRKLRERGPDPVPEELKPEPEKVTQESRQRDSGVTHPKRSRYERMTPAERERLAEQVRRASPFYQPAPAPAEKPKPEVNQVKPKPKHDPLAGLDFFERERARAAAIAEEGKRNKARWAKDPASRPPKMSPEFERAHKMIEQRRMKAERRLSLAVDRGINAKTDAEKARAKAWADVWARRAGLKKNGKTPRTRFKP